MLNITAQEMQIKASMRYHFIHIRIASMRGKKKITSVSQDMEKPALSCTVGRIIKLYSLYEETVWSFFKKIRNRINIWAIISLDISIYIYPTYIYICPKVLKSWTQRGIFPSMFIAALFTIANIWKQLKYPSTYEWVKKCGAYMYHIYAIAFEN